VENEQDVAVGEHGALATDLFAETITKLLRDTPNFGQQGLRWHARPPASSLRMGYRDGMMFPRTIASLALLAATVSGQVKIPEVEAVANLEASGKT